LALSKNTLTINHDAQRICGDGARRWSAVGRKGVGGSGTLRDLDINYSLISMHK
jgi:hypothetical protein